ncbi:uncharacterized protein [Rutidosis leptorrhynchoides]|uniref:uncharacterized protein n=1 Tax=Rutidosis leptorrhynchoides TaxID=125765 RepID=UPI003A991BD8
MKRAKTEVNQIIASAVWELKNLEQILDSNGPSYLSKILFFFLLLRIFCSLMKIASLNVRGFGSGEVSKFGDVRNLCISERPSILPLQETKCHSRDDKWFFALWGSMDCGFTQKEMIGKSGGQMLVWDTNIFEVNSELVSEFFIAIRGKWKSSGKESIIVNVYGPHDDVKKKKMWDSLDHVMNITDVSWILCGDFNEVRGPSERLNCEFFRNRAIRFNEFITRNGLVEIPLGGRKFTRISDDGIKMSKLDRFLVSDTFLPLWPDLKVVALDRKFSNHCPIMLMDSDVDFGPKPFKIFDEWFRIDGVEDTILKSWGEVISGNRKDCVFRNKLKRLKFVLKEWSKNHLGGIDLEIQNAKNIANDFESKAETGLLSSVDHEAWLDSRKTWLEKERIKANMLK